MSDPSNVPFARQQRRAQARRRRRRKQVLLAIVAAVAAVLAGAWIAFSPLSEHRPVRRAASARRPPKTVVLAHQRATAREAILGKEAVARFVRLHEPIYCGGHRGRAVALTFDDGPGPYTHLALRLLRRYRARATFFLVGRLLEGWPQIPARELRLGTLGDHTWSHADLALLPPTAIAGELAKTRQAIASLVHVDVRLFRPPYGARNAAVDRVARQLRMLEVLWNVDSLDSEGADAAKIARNVKSHLSPGAIILMHENRGQTIKALTFTLLPELRRLHYRLVSIPELLATDPPSVTQLHRGLGGCSKNTLSLRARGA